MESCSHMFGFCGNVIETTVAATASVVDHWLHSILSRNNADHNSTTKGLMVGFDCKYKPHPIKSMSSKIATLQLCVESKCLIVQLLYLDSIPVSLGNFLSGNSDVTIYGVEMNEKVSKLRSEYGLLLVNSCCKKVDIRALVKAWYPMSFRGKPGLKAMAYEVAGLSMRKRKSSVQPPDWESRFMSEELVEYGSVDAYACYRIANGLLTQSLKLKQMYGGILFPKIW